MSKEPFILSLSKDCISFHTLRSEGQPFDRLRANGSGVTEVKL